MASNETISIDVLINSANSANSVKELRNSIKALQDAALQAGNAGNDALATKLTQAAGKAKDKMSDLRSEVNKFSSDTKNLDGAIGVTKGLAAGFALAQGAAALFGTENKNVEKALLKVQAAMAILNGIQEVANLLQKESAASLFISNSYQQIKALLLTETTAAQTANTVATEAGVVAQEELNVAMEANPAGILILAVVALGAAFAAYSASTDETKNNQEELNKSFDDSIKKLERLRDLAAAAGNTDRANLLDLTVLYQNRNNLASQFNDLLEKQREQNKKAKFEYVSKSDKEKLQKDLDDVQAKIEDNDQKISISNAKRQKESFDKGFKELTEQNKKKEEANDDARKKREKDAEEEAARKKRLDMEAFRAGQQVAKETEAEAAKLQKQEDDDFADLLKQAEAEVDAEIDLANYKANKLMEIAKAEREERAALQKAEFDASVQLANELVDAIGTIAQRRSDAEQEGIDKRKEAALAQLEEEQAREERRSQKLTIQQQTEEDKKTEFEERKTAIEKKALDEQRQAKIKEFNLEKKLTLVKIALDLAATVAKINGIIAVQTASVVGAPLVSVSTIALATAIASAAIEAGVVASQKPPAFASGGLVRGPGTGTSDSIHAKLSNGEAVINARSTAMFLPQLDMMNRAGGGAPLYTPGFATGGVASNGSIDTSRLEEIISSFASRPIKTYVVSTEMSEQQRRDGVIVKRSKF